MGRTRRLVRTFLLLVALPLLAAAQPAGTPAPDPAKLLKRWDADAVAVEEALQQGAVPQAELDRIRARLEEQQARVPELKKAAEAAVQPIRQELEALGEAPGEGETEAETIAKERGRLQNKLAEAEALVKQISQADARAEAMISEIINQRRALFTRQLLTRGPSVLDPANLASGTQAIRETGRLIVAEIRERIGTWDPDVDTLAGRFLPLLLLVAALFAIRTVRRLSVARLSRMVGAETPQARRVTVGVALTLTRLLTPIAGVGLVLLAIYRSDLLGPEGLQFVEGVAIATMLFAGAYALSLAYFAPGAQRLRLSALDDAKAYRAHWWMVALAAVVALDRALVVGGEHLDMSVEGLMLLNAGLLVPGGIALWQLVRQIATRDAPKTTVAEQIAEESEDEEAAEREEGAIVPALAALLRLFGRISAVAGPVLALLGYFAASRYVFYPLVFSGAVIGLCLLLFQVVQAGVEQIVSRRQDTGAVAERRKGQIRLIPVLVGFLLACGAIPVLALVWGASVSDLALVWRHVREGIQLGEISIAPGDFFAFVLVFSIGFLVTRMLQAVLGRSVLPLTGLDVGGRDAIRAGVGYLGIVLAALAAIATAGIDLSNLAIALGALSVGIGFGLQNVVNNFVSGIILLVERPIKTGDWVELGSGMGYVKRINVRSTEIETFDRSSLIVPNSELISGPVVNWTHSNNNGRIIVPVAVAYGTEPRKVEKILLEVVKQHPMLLRRPAPYVLFKNFGADGLEFEIRGVLRDVNWVLNTGSDLRYEIAQRFSEEGIEVPFAQRDLHLRNAEEVARAFAAQIGRRGEATPQGDGSRREPGETSEPPEEEADGVELLRLADPQAGRLVKGPAGREPTEDAPWETLAEAGDELGDEPPEERDEDPLSGRRALRSAAGLGDSDGAGGDGR